MSKPEVISIKTALLTMVDTIRVAGIAGLTPVREIDDFTKDLYVSWVLASNVEATIHIDVRCFGAGDGHEVRFRLTWPSSYRSVSASIAAADLYIKVATLAALLDAQWGGQTLYPKKHEPSMKVEEVSQKENGILRCVLIPTSFPDDAQIHVGSLRGRGLAARLPLSFVENGMLSSSDEDTDCPVYAVRDVAIGTRIMVEYRTVCGWHKAIVCA